VKRCRLCACCSTSSTIAFAEAFLGYPAATQAGTLMSRFETILNLIAACQLQHKTGASASGGDPHPPDFLKHAQKSPGPEPEMAHAP
jgi:hypothetical protein